MTDWKQSLKFIWPHHSIGNLFSFKEILENYIFQNAIPKWQKTKFINSIFSSVQFSPSVVSDSLRPHESQHARPPCPSPTPGVYSDSASPLLTSLKTWNGQWLSQFFVTLCDPRDYSLPGSSVHGILQARILECCHFFLQGIFPSQGSKLGLPHCRQILYYLSHQGSPYWLHSFTNIQGTRQQIEAWPLSSPFHY